MEKRVLMAVVLSFLVLYGYQAMFVPKQVPKPKAAQSEQASGSAASAPGQSATPGTGPATGPGSAQPAQSGPVGAPGSAPSAQAAAFPAYQGAAPVVSDTDEREIVIETDALRGVFTNRGAALKSWRLKRYKDKAGRPVDLVPQTLAGAPKPFFLALGNDAVDARANSALFRVDGAGATQDPKTGVYVLAFEYREAGGLSIRKTFAVDAAKFTINAAVDATIGGTPANVGIVMGPARATRRRWKSAAT